MPDAAYFMLRATRRGPLVPARIWLCDHDPADETNKLDRGRLSVYPRADIAGEEVDPERFIEERLCSATDWSPAQSPSHWRYAQPIDEAEYRFQIAHRAWAAQHRPEHPTVRPRQVVDAAQMPLPVFGTP
jgi:hypothetical protein